jgi:hypothetical protein
MPKAPQFISARGQAGMDIQPEPRQHGEWPGPGIIWQRLGLKYVLRFLRTWRSIVSQRLLSELV